MVRFASPIFTMDGMQPEAAPSQSSYHSPTDQSHASQPYNQFADMSAQTSGLPCPLPPPNPSQTFVPPVVPTADNRPIHFSDGVLYAHELQQHSGDATTNEENNETLPENLMEVYNHLGIVGKLLTSGSLMTIRLLQICRNLSETLVDALGIARPKYEGELKAYEEMKQEVAQQQTEVQQLYAGWTPPQPPQPPPPPSSGPLNYSGYSSSNTFEYHAPIMAPTSMPYAPPMMPVASVPIAPPITAPLITPDAMPPISAEFSEPSPTVSPSTGLPQ